MHASSRLKWGGRVLCLLGLLALGAALAGCGRCGDGPWTQSQIGACHSDPPRQS